jgi:hypothetical protein
MQLDTLDLMQGVSGDVSLAPDPLPLKRWRLTDKVVLGYEKNQIPR